MNLVFNVKDEDYPSFRQCQWSNTAVFMDEFYSDKTKRNLSIECESLEEVRKMQKRISRWKNYRGLWDVSTITRGNTLFVRKDVV